ncbi:MAG TPA: oligosaccharide flippase family protein, partial [Thermoanaerobaculia bacterium]
AAGSSLGGSILKPALILTSGRMLAFGASFFIPVVLARLFTPAEFGTYKQLFVLVSTLYYGPPLALATSLYFFVPRWPENAGRYVANATAALVVCGAVCAAVMVGLSGQIAWVFSNPRLAPHLPALAVYLLAMMVSAPLEILMVCRERIRWASWTFALSDLSRAILLIVPALLTADLGWLLRGAVAFAVVRCLVLAAYLRKELAGGLRLDAGILRTQLAYTLPFGCAVLLATAQTYFHQVVVAHTFDAATFAIYSVGCLQIPIVDFVATPAADVMMVRMGEALRENRLAAVLAAWRDTVGGLALLFFPLVGLLVLLAGEIIVVLFTASYAASIPIFVLWSTLILLVPIQSECVLRAFAKTRAIFVISGLRLLFVAAFIWPCLARFGLLGAVIVTLGGEALGRGAALWKSRELLGVGWGRLLPWKELLRLAAAALLALGLAAAAKTLASSHWTALLVGGTTYVACYWTLARFWGVAPDLLAPLRRRLGWRPASPAPDVV